MYNICQIQNTKKENLKPESKKETKPLKMDSETFITHRVQSGESLWDISRQYGVTIEQIVEWNKKQTTKVKAGELLKIRK